MRIRRQTLRGEQTATPRRVWIFVTLLSAAAVSLAVFLSQIPSLSGTRHELPWLAIAVTLFATSTITADFHAGRSSLTADIGAVAVLVGIVLVAPFWLLVAVALAGLAYSWHRHYRLRSWIFNAANQAVGAGCGVLVFRTSIDGGSPVSVRGWLALVLALLTFEVITNALIAVVISLMDGKPSRQYFRSLARQQAIMVPLNCTIGIVAVTACWTNRWAIVFLAGPALALGVWYRSANTLKSRFNDLQSLYGFGISLAHVSERSEVLLVGLRETREILHCRVSELLVPQGNGPGLRYRLSDEGQVIRELYALSPLERSVSKGSGAIILQRDDDDETLRDRGVTDLMGVPVPIAEGSVAVLVAAGRAGAKATFENADLRLFETLAAHLSTALTSSGRLDQLRHEVAAREHQAFHDSLTGLANRTLFVQELADTLDQADGRHDVAVLLLDLDGFKEINDTLGHHTGDSILKEVGSRVDAAVGIHRMAARLGGDEFAFVISDAGSSDDVVGIANEILDAIAAPLSVEGIVLSLRGSIGIAISPVHGADTSILLRRADVAMYSAKSSTRGVMVYDTKIDHYSTRRLILATELQRAITSRELEVWYQPLADLGSGQVCGFEALLRWRHPEYGPVSPDEFIPVAEQTGIIETLTSFVLKAALSELSGWRARGFDFEVAVNVSARSLLDTEIVERFRRILQDAGVAAPSLTLEITESSVMLDSERSEAILRDLAKLGVKIAIDDFGTGYSSLSRLKNLPVHLVKIDRSFVKHMCNDKGDEAIVRSTIDLARNMGHVVVAEGVEDQATWDRLQDLGCDLAQGYFLSAAMPPEQCHSWLLSRQSPTLAPIRQLRMAAEG